MGFSLNSLGTIGIILLLSNSTLQNVHYGVDLVTKLSNTWVPVIIKEISKEHENVVTSPYGLLSNLGMLLEATRGKTREEFLQALNITADDVGDLRKGFKAYCDLFLKYSNDPEAAGSFNSASMVSSFKLNATYKETLEKYYCANITENSGKMNHTTLELGSITGVMSHWKDYDKLAVYTFLSHQPMKPFKKRDGTIVGVPMIPQVGVFRGGRWENSNVILLPLQAKLVELLLIVPDEVAMLDVTLKKLHEITIPVLVESLQKQEIEVFVPQASIVNKNYNLTSMLVRNGIRRVFDPVKANLSKASSFGPNDIIHLTKFDQNAFFSTSFVAVNSVSGISSASGNRRRRRNAKSIYLDQPFLFFVIQKDTQLVLLSGKLENPVQVPL
ncbi:hypothetical protein RUM44_012474 [Polyplax serrata]|uniref:Serpin domain-containing protein n=1 Tax=Polyplax serrata TaxID=468196 RepID=A0ABR1BBR0_POLSC